MQYINSRSFYRKRLGSDQYYFGSFKSDTTADGPMASETTSCSTNEYDQMYLTQDAEETRFRDFAVILTDKT